MTDKPLTDEEINGLRAHYPDKERHSDIHALLATIAAMQRVVDAAHFLLCWTHQDGIAKDADNGKWRITDLHPSVWNRLNSGERELWNALSALAANTGSGTDSGGTVTHYMQGIDTDFDPGRDI